jgi:hypothetical protein
MIVNTFIERATASVRDLASILTGSEQVGDNSVLIDLDEEIEYTPDSQTGYDLLELIVSAKQNDCGYLLLRD